MKTDLLTRLLEATKPLTCQSWHISYHRENEIRDRFAELAAAVAAGARLMIPEAAEPEPAEIVHWWPGGIDDPVACGVSAASQGYHFRFESHPMAAYIVTCPACIAAMQPPTPRTWGVLTMEGV